MYCFWFFVPTLRGFISDPEIGPHLSQFGGDWYLNCKAEHGLPWVLILKWSCTGIVYKIARAANGMRDVWCWDGYDGTTRLWSIYEWSGRQLFSCSDFYAASWLQMQWQINFLEKLKLVSSLASSTKVPQTVATVSCLWQQRRCALLWRVIHCLKLQIFFLAPMGLEHFPHIAELSVLGYRPSKIQWTCHPRLALWYHDEFRPGRWHVQGLLTNLASIILRHWTSLCSATMFSFKFENTTVTADTSTWVSLSVQHVNIYDSLWASVCLILRLQ